MSVEIDDVAGVTQPRLVPGESPHVVVCVGLQTLQIVGAAWLCKMQKYVNMTLGGERKERTFQLRDVDFSENIIQLRKYTYQF